MNNYFDNRNDDIERSYEDDNYGYTQEELDDMYRAAFDGNDDAYWNID